MSASHSHATTRHIPQLDGIRAIAILAVIACHVWLTLDHRVLHRLMSAGVAGVDLFFVLSGFLITGILLDSRDDPRYLRNFYGRRILRIWPIYYAVLVFILFIWPSNNFDLVRQSWALYVFWAANFVPADAVPLAAAVMWSLAVEEQFYIVWPFIVRYCNRQALFWVCIGIVILAPIIRFMLSPHHDFMTIRTMTVCRMDTLAAGALLCLITRDPRLSADALRRAGWWLATVGGTAWLVDSAFGLHEIFRRYGDSLHYSIIVAGASGLLLLALYSGTVAKLLRSKPLVEIGRVSYGIYLYHAFALVGVSWAIERLRIASSIANSLALLAAVTVTSYLVAWLSFRLVEQPILGLKVYFGGEKQPRSPAVMPASG